MNFLNRILFLLFGVSFATKLSLKEAFVVGPPDEENEEWQLFSKKEQDFILNHPTLEFKHENWTNIVLMIDWERVEGFPDEDDFTEEDQIRWDAIDIAQNEKLQNKLDREWWSSLTDDQVHYVYNNVDISEYEIGEVPMNVRRMNFESREDWPHSS